MTLKELIKALRRFEKDNNNLPVVIATGPCGYIEEVDEVKIARGPENGWHDYIEIVAYEKRG